MTTGIAHGHAGEILQGSVERAGKVRRVLVSLPAPELLSRAVFHALPFGGLRVYPVWKWKARRAAELTLKTLGCLAQSGIVELSSRIPACCGLGSSTSDCVAAIRAIAAHCETVCSPETIGEIAHQAEQSSDATMFDDCVVAFLHCEGQVLEVLGSALPRMRMLVAQPYGPAELVSTDSLCRPQYSATQMDRFDRLLARLRAGLGTGDASVVGAVATASAEMNQSFLPKPHFDAIASIGLRTHALGVAAAHSGTVLSLLFAEKAEEQIADACALLKATRLNGVRGLRTWSDAIK
jgi:uncharacterized protein involved in propanediol utilization